MYKSFLFLLFLSPLGAISKPALDTSLAQVAKEYRDLEATISALEEEVKGLDRQIQEKSQLLSKQYKLTNNLLITLYRLRKNLPVHMASHLKQPEVAIQSTIMLDQYVRSLYSQLKKISTELHELEEYRQQKKQKKLLLKQESEPLKKKQTELEHLIHARKKALKKTSKDYRKISQQAHTIARKSTNLKELIEKTEPPAKPTGPFATGYEPNPRKKYAVKPVQGKIVSSFNNNHPFNFQGKGVVFTTQPNEFVFAPLTGRIAYAGPFRRYKNIVIISHNKHYHTILTNLDRLEVFSEEWVEAGDPLGQMGTTKDKSFLYLELRQKGAAVDPHEWLAPSAS